MIINRQQSVSSNFNADENILPLINIVFLLLIFFLVAGKISPSDPFSLEPPSSSSELPAERSDLIIHIGSEGQIAIDGQQVEEAFFEETLVRNITDANNNLVWVKADATIEANELIKLLKVLNRNGVQSIRLLTIRGPN